MSIRALMLASLSPALLAWLLAPASPAEGTVAPRLGQEVREAVPEALPGDTLDWELEAAIRAATEREASVRELLAIYRRMEGLRNVRLHFEEGILEISGTALSAEARAHAVELAEGLPGVVWVHNRLTVETHLGRRLAPAIESLREKGIDFLRILPSILVALVLILGSALLAYWVGERSFPFDRMARNSFARNLLRQVARAVILLLGVVLALELLDATALVGAVLGTAGIFGIAVGFAFRDIVENYLAGVLLSVRQPFSPNDHVQLSGHDGRVVRLTGRETILMTLDGNHVRIPNATVFKAVITNLTRNPRRRFMVEVSVAPWEELPRALSLGKAAVAGVPGVLGHPSPAARIHELQDSAVEIRIFGWVDQSVADFGKTRSEAIRAVKEAFEREAVATPPPEYGIRLLEAAEPVAEEAEPVAEEEAPRPRPRARATPEPAAEAPDVSPDTTIEEEIALELATSDEENLLTSSGGEEGRA